MKATLILLFGYLFLERFLFRGSLGRLFVRGWRRLFRDGWNALSRALRLPAGRREKQTQLTCRDCPELLPDFGSLVPHVSYAVEAEPPYHERTEWKMPSKQRLRRERPEGTEEMIVGTFDPETGEEIEQRKISLAGSQSVKEEVSRTLDALFEQEFMPEPPDTDPVSANAPKESMA